MDMIGSITLKQSQRSVLLIKKDLLEALQAAIQDHRNGDVFQIKAALLQHTDWTEPEESFVDGDSGSITPEIKEKVEKDQYYRLYDELKKNWAPRKKAPPKDFQISAALNPLLNKLYLLVQALSVANVGPDGKVAHRDLGTSEADQFIAQKIHLAQTNILIFIDMLVNKSAEVGDADMELFNALRVSGFMSALLDYLKDQGCNMQGAADLNKALNRIQCTRKS
jgi:hypothetical protein